jgi:DNA invertase Pin-like site-specific DNA recombinase
MRYGYDRVSSKTQSFDGQVEQLEAAGCTRIFREKASAKDADRPQFKRLMKTVQAGDVIVVCKLDRLCRSSRDLFNTLHQLAEVGCGFTSLGENWCDTESDVGRLLIAVMSGVSEFERSMIKSRTAPGRKARSSAGRRRSMMARSARLPSSTLTARRSRRWRRNTRSASARFGARCTDGAPLPVEVAAATSASISPNWVRNSPAAGR